MTRRKTHLFRAILERAGSFAEFCTHTHHTTQTPEELRTLELSAPNLPCLFFFRKRDTAKLRKTNHTHTPPPPAQHHTRFETCAFSHFVFESKGKGGLRYAWLGRRNTPVSHLTCAPTKRFLFSEHTANVSRFLFLLQDAPLLGKEEAPFSRHYPLIYVETPLTPSYFLTV